MRVDTTTNADGFTVESRPEEHHRPFATEKKSLDLRPERARAEMNEPTGLVQNGWTGGTPP